MTTVGISFGDVDPVGPGAGGLLRVGGLGAAGFEDLLVLVINDYRAEEYVDDVEDFDLPILQDTEAADVFGLYEAYSYDMFIVDREGFLGFKVTRHPLDERDETLEEILAFR